MDTNEIMQRVGGWGNFGQMHSDVFSAIFKHADPDRPLIVVELGVASGRGLATLAFLARGKSIKVFGVDHFQGTKGESREYYFNDWDGISAANVRLNLRNVEIQDDEYTIIEKDTVAAAADFTAVDYVFLDADHSYEGCVADIRAWWPLVVPGGFIGGHDLPMPSVGKAVKEFFPNYNKVGQDCWNYQKPL